MNWSDFNFSLKFKIESSKLIEFSRFFQNYKILPNVNNSKFTEISAFLLINSESSLRLSIALVFVDDFDVIVVDIWTVFAC